MSGIQYVEANGSRFAFLSEGEGPLVLAFHGFPDTAHTWDRIRAPLAGKGYRVVTPFLRGYRPSSIPDRDTDQETLGRDVIALIDAFGASRATLIGHDWGASGVYAATQIAPERVDKLVAVAIPLPATLRPTLRKLWAVRHMFAFKLPGARKRFAANDFAQLREVYHRWSPTWETSDDDFAAVRTCFEDPASLDAALGYYRALSFRIPAWARRKIDVDTVVFAGLDDPNADVDDYEHARRMFTGDYVIEAMPGGHFLHNEHPREFLERLLKHF